MQSSNEAMVLDRLRLKKQLELQKAKAWDLESGLNWQQGISLDRYFLPLDADAIAFKGASKEQRLVLSQWMGLVVNQSIAEMERAAFRLKEVSWRNFLYHHPQSQEFENLGEQFFLEEAKHSEAFKKYLKIFCQSQQIDMPHIKKFLPCAESSSLLNRVLSNAKDGGIAFWWIVSMVEEESVLIFSHMNPFRKVMDPLYFALHQKHFEEESRHAQYAFMMLEHLRNHGRFNLRSLWHRKVDHLYAETWTAQWVLQELSKLFDLTANDENHEFFKILRSCFKLFPYSSTPKVLWHLFSGAPYISSMLNRRYHKRTTHIRKRFGALSLPYPEPQKVQLSCE